MAAGQAQSVIAMSAITPRRAHELPALPHASTLDRTRWLLACGVAAPLLYFATDLAAALRYPGYSYADQAISELSAVGAPTRSMWLPLGVAYSILTIAYSFGAWRTAGPKRSLRAVAAMIAAIGLLGLVAWPFAPMHQREVLAAGGGTTSDTVHLMLGGADTLLFVACIALGANASGRRFRLYSIATLAAVVLAGGATAMQSPSVASNDATPWLGISERIAVFGSMFWTGALAVALWRTPPQR